MMETQNPHQPPSRYKTVRRVNPPAQSAPHHSPTPQAPVQNQPPSSNNDGLARSRSRYRKRPTIDTSTVEAPNVSIPAPVPVPAIPKEFSPIQAVPKSLPDSYPKTPTNKQAPPTLGVELQRGYGQSPPTTAPTPNVTAPFQPERKINVQVGKETLSVAVPTDTEASTLAAAVSKLVPDKTIPGASILLESFKGLGLERPVRKYERVRDIMNSWEDDTKNTLILISSLSGGEGLNAANAPVEPPEPCSAWLSYMVKPGKWSKRWMTMRDGALLMAKKETTKKDKDSQQICHLSDFDVYDPSPTTAINVLKCPKRHCFAVKSQQKASLFQNTSDWVHYFATNDRTIYTAWQNVLRNYRSYYLVQVKGLGKLPEPDKSSSGDDQKEERLARGGRNNEDKTPPSTAAGQSNPASPARKKFTPLITEEELARPLPLTESSLRRSKSLKGNSKHGASATPTGPPPDGSEQVFAPTGLLGRTYTLKVKEMQETEKEQTRARANAPLFTPASAMAKLANGVPVRTNTTKYAAHKRASSVESVAFDFEQRQLASLSGSQRVAQQQQLSRTRTMTATGKTAPKPLLEFAEGEIPPNPPPNQPRSRYRARTLVTNGSAPCGTGRKGLIAGATSPAAYDAPQLPSSSTLWGRSKSRPPTRDGADAHNHAFPVENPFTGTGLLAYSQEGAGAITTGHGVMRKNPDGTLLDLRNRSVFAEGSLLAKIEKEKGVEPPVLDRRPEASDSD